MDITGYFLIAHRHDDNVEMSRWFTTYDTYGFVYDFSDEGYVMCYDATIPDLLTYVKSVTYDEFLRMHKKDLFLDCVRYRISFPKLGVQWDY